MSYECNEASLTPNVDLDECNQGGSVPMNQWGGTISVHVGDLQTSPSPKNLKFSDISPCTTKNLNFTPPSPQKKLKLLFDIRIANKKS